MVGAIESRTSTCKNCGFALPQAELDCPGCENTAALDYVGPVALILVGRSALISARFKRLLPSPNGQPTFEPENKLEIV